LLFSYGLDDCQGKSTLLNQIFGTTFEESNNSQFFQGTTDVQGDRNFIHHRATTIIDVHGEITDTTKSLLALADGVILHVSEQMWNNT
jgi:hypothetical protein